MNIVYKGETLKYIEDFHGEPVLWITNPSQRFMEHMTFVGGYSNEYCIYLRDLPEIDNKNIKSQVAKRYKMTKEYITYFDETPDVETYHALRESVDWAVFCKEQSENALKNSCFCVVAKDGDNTVAMGRVVGDGMYYTIVDVMVKPQYQGQKIGSAIVNRLVDLISAGIPEGGRTSIQLIAAPGKEGFYVKQGFKVLPNENSGPALRKVIYT